MQVSLFIDTEEKVVMLAAPLPREVEGEKLRGTFRAFIHPGEDFHGFTYEELLAMGTGKHELTFPHSGSPQESAT